MLIFGDIEECWCYFNVWVMIGMLLKFGVVLIINENDFVVIFEICYGDNDCFVVWVVIMVSVDCLVLLFDIDGFYIVFF